MAVQFIDIYPCKYFHIFIENKQINVAFYSLIHYQLTRLQVQSKLLPSEWEDIWATSWEILSSGVGDQLRLKTSLLGYKS